MIYRVLLYQSFLNSYRRIFYNKLLLTNVIILILFFYAIIMIFHASFLLRAEVNRSMRNFNQLIINCFLAIYFLDFLTKLLFNHINQGDIYPYLRLKIPRNMLANYLILNNHFKMINFFGYMILVPLLVILWDKIEPSSYVIILISTILIFTLNSYISMTLDIFRIKLLFFLCLVIFIISFSTIFRFHIYDFLNILMKYRYLLSFIFLLIIITSISRIHLLLNATIIKRLIIS